MKYWEHSTENQLLERSEPFLATWPKSGTMLDNKVYELPMQALPINDSEFSSLPTLKARDHQAEGYEAGLRRATPQLGTIVKGIVDKDERVMLPTPRANEPGSTSVGYGDSLNDFASRVVNGYDKKDITLLRSPTASQGQGGALGEAEARRRGNTVGIRDQAMDIAKAQGLKVSRSVDNLFPTPNTMDHLPARSPEKIAESKLRTPGGYSNVRETVVNDLMPTPTTRDYKDGSQPHERDGKVQTDTVARAVLNSGEVKLFNTPTTMDAKATNNPEIAQKFLDQGRQTCLTYDVVEQVKLFPTLRASDSYERRNQKTMDRIARDGGDMTMTTLARTTTNWGKFEPAIRRWEATIGRQAPEPTKPDGKEGNHRLSSKFTEWMMGLPDGWITDIGLKRNDELKACGNGVVPQQAELALSLLGIKEILERN
jgi:hypothetical protein